MSFIHFTIGEFACKCGCGANRIDEELVRRLDWIRAAYYPWTLNVSSGYRCAARDRAVGGNGNHPTGLAADLIVSKGARLRDFILACHAAGIPRIVLYHNLPHVHVDMVPNRPEGIYIR
ncbi:MAG: peptidase M15 [Nitrospinae bacterium]|nr:peptidase M15 [Nitrospinota bacterium]